MSAVAPTPQGYAQAEQYDPSKNPYAPAQGVSVMAPPQNVVMIPFIPYTSDGFTGTDPGIQTITQDATRIIYRASYHKCQCCSGDPARSYFHVLENSYERNAPVVILPAPFCWFNLIPSNCCCNGVDEIYKSFFDRGPWDQQSCLHWCKYYNGAPEPFAGEIQFQICCMDCCQCFNNFVACYFPEIFGERVRMSTCQKFMWCCPTTTCWLHNMCGCFGPKSGQPICLSQMAFCLKGGTSTTLTQALMASRGAWMQRTGKK